MTLEDVRAAKRRLEAEAEQIIDNYLREGEGEEKVVARIVGKGQTVTPQELRAFSSHIGGATISTIMDSGLGLEFILIGEDFKVYHLVSRPNQLGVLTELSTIEEELE